VNRLLLVALSAFSFTAGATAMEPPSPDAALEARLKKLETELRCLVCQNQTLADSSAGLADDLRREVRALAVAGKSDAEIKAYLVARYGDFVLYNPPLKSTTWLLWGGPFALLAGGALLWWVILWRRSRRVPPDAVQPDPSAEQHARAILEGVEPPGAA
jgi:cytochrome c-type biogenesis protein CcmH